MADSDQLVVIAHVSECTFQALVMNFMIPFNLYCLAKISLRASSALCEPQMLEVSGYTSHIEM